MCRGSAEGVKILEDIHKWGDRRAAMIEDPMVWRSCRRTDEPDQMAGFRFAVIGCRWLQGSVNGRERRSPRGS
jgi:hypothetical protein